MSLTTDFSPLTFEGIKQQILTQLKSSDAFFDYEYTGARLNALVDALSYTVLYGGAYANASVIESWRQLAVQRENVVQHAQNVGYVPSSKQSAQADVEITLTRNTPALTTYATIPRGTKFSGQKGATTYPFVVTSDITILGVNLYQSIIPVSQGRFLSTTTNWTATSRVFIKDANIDRRYTKVTVNNEVWKKSDSAARVEKDEKVFYVRETLDGWTEIYFGVSNLEAIEGQVDMSMYVGGKTPTPGDVIVVEYLVSDGEDANGTDTFKITSAVPGFTATVTPAANKNASGGAAQEDIERIRTVSDKMWQAQGRCVTPADYENFILAEFGSMIDAIRCWTQRGNLGYAMIAIKPKNALYFNPSQEQVIVDYLKKYNVSVVEPTIVAPVYIFIDHTIEVDYDPNLLDITEVQLSQNILLSMENYYKTSINDFGIGYQTSKLLKAIDDTHKSILGSSCDIDVVKEFEVEKWWKDLVRGSSLSAPTEIRGISTAPFTYHEYDDTQEPPFYVQSHELQVFSTDSGKLVMGPFLPTKDGITWVECLVKPNSAVYAPLPPPILDPLAIKYDFNEPTDLYFDENDDDYMAKVKYYEIGSYITENDSKRSTFQQINFDDVQEINQFRWVMENVDEEFIKYSIKSVENSIYPDLGEIIVFDQYLRPEYIKLKPIAVSS